MNENVKVLVINGDIWFIAKDIAKILGYSNTKAAIRDHVLKCDQRILKSSPGISFKIPNRGLTIINWSGFFSLIFSSDNKQTQNFVRWVFCDLLKKVYESQWEN